MLRHSSRRAIASRSATRGWSLQFTPSLSVPPSPAPVHLEAERPARPRLVLTPRVRRSRVPAFLLVLAVLALSGGVVVAAVAISSRGPDLRPGRGDRAAQGTKRFVVSSRRHVPAPVVYPQTPPVGGDHTLVFQNCGFYPRPILTERGVHSLEHGAVWVTYRPDLEAVQRERLRGACRRG